jgi:hypothetical protein
MSDPCCLIPESDLRIPNADDCIGSNKGEPLARSGKHATALREDRFIKRNRTFNH